MTTDTEARVRSALDDCAEAMRVDARPPFDDLLSPVRPRRVVRAPSVRPLVALAATVVLVVAAIALLCLDDPTPPAVRTALRPSSPVVWPLADEVPAGVLATPESTGQAYVTDVLRLGPEWGFHDQETEGDRWAQRQYTHATVDLELFVQMARIDDLWFVTEVRTSNSPIVRARFVGDIVELETSFDGFVLEGMEWGPPAMEVVSGDGQQVWADDSDLWSERASTGDGGWRSDLLVGAEARPGPAVARVTSTVVDRATGATATVVSSSIVVPLPRTDHPAEDLFPAVMPARSYHDAWVYTLTHPGDPRSDWQWALTSYITTTMTARRPPPAPTFTDVVTSDDGLRMSGRFAGADGGAGTFELARLQADGTWFLLSLVDDAYDVRDVTTTATGVEATVALREDTTMAIGCGCRAPAGRTLDEVMGRAGGEFVIVRPFEPAGATTSAATIRVAFQAVDDGGLFRYFDAWAP